MDKTFPEVINGIRHAVFASEVREDIAQMGEYLAAQNRGLTQHEKELLLTLLENASYKTDTMQPTLNALRAEWDNSTQEIPVQIVSLSTNSMTLNEGESKTLTATVLPENATNKTVTWSISPTGFATVVNGVVTAQKAGSCTVTATAGGKSANCAVTVYADGSAPEVPVESITLSASTMTLNEGQSKPLIAFVSPDNATNKTVTWSVDRAGVVTVKRNSTSQCTVTGNTAGSCTVTATAGSISKSCAVTVKGIEAQSETEVTQNA